MSRTAWQRKAPDVYWSQGDTAPAISEILKDGLGVAVNLTGASVRFQATFPGAASPEIDSAATLSGTPTDGTVTYTPVTADTDTIGDLLVQWKVTFAGGAIERFPNSGYQKVRIIQKVA